MTALNSKKNMGIPLKVLIVEDNDDDLDLLLRHLRSEGYEPTYELVYNVVTMSTALSDSTWDIVISDYLLPEFSAPDALKILRKSFNCEIPFIVVSGNVGEEIAAQLMQYGANDYINKDNLTRLCPAIKREIEESQVRRQYKSDQAKTKRLWNIIDNSLNEIYVFNCDTLYFELVNQSAINNLGYSAEELYAMRPFELTPEISQKEFISLLNPLYLGKDHLLEFETKFKRKDGSTYPTSISLQLSQDRDDRVFFAVVLDITDKIETSNEIEYLSRFPQENPSPVLRIDNNRNVLYANPAGLSIIENWNKNERLKAPKHWQKIIDICIENATIQEFNDTTQNRHYHWLASPTSNKLNINCYALDITEQVKAEQDLKQAAQVFDKSIECIMIMDAERKIVRVNAALLKTTGYPEPEIIGKQPDILQSSQHRPTFYQSFWKELDFTNGWQGESWNKKKSGEVYPVEISVSIVRDDKNNIINYIAVFSDITERKKAEQHIHKLAYFDTLTGLPNRFNLQNILSDIIISAHENQDKVSIIKFDLNRFKTINESLGHHLADQVLKIMSNQLLDVLPKNTTLGRMGGDEFLLIVKSIEIQDEQAEIIDLLNQAIEKSIRLNNQDIYLNATVGVSTLCSENDTAEKLIKNAEAALNRAKVDGIKFQSFSNDLSIHSLESISMESDLRKALERNEFVLHYQPQIDLANNTVVGLEALIRWQKPDGKLVPPGVFIPILEDTGLIIPVGTWVLFEACTQSMLWQSQGINMPRIAVNLSAKQFNQNNFTDIIHNIISKTGIDPSLLELEVTESTIMRRYDYVINILQELHQSNIHLSIDDFGTGYSSLSYLKHFPIDLLKIDMSFVREIPGNNDDTAIVNTIVSMGHNLNLKVIAEGVETDEQRECLKNMGCELAQGYFFSKPLNVKDCFQYLKTHCS